MLIERNGPKHVDELLESVSKSYPREAWIGLFGNSHDLTTFFKLHSNIFHVHSNIVDIVPYNLRRATEPSLSLTTVSETSAVPKTSTSQPDSFSPPPPVQLQQQQQQSLKQRVSSILMKTIADNSGREQQHRPAQSPSAVPDSPTHQPHPQREITSPSKIRVLQSTRVVSSAKESATIVTDILSGPPGRVVAFDLEGVNLGSSTGEVS